MTRVGHTSTVILLVVALLFGGALSLAAPQPAAADVSTWTPTGAMTTSRVLAFGGGPGQRQGPRHRWLR